MSPEPDQSRESPSASFRELFDHASDCILLLRVAAGAPFRLVGANSAAERKLGFSPSASIGRDLGELVPPETAAQLSDACCRCVDASAPVEHEWEGVFPAGRRWLQTTVVPATTAPVQLLLAIVRDVTEERQAARELRQLKEQFQHAQKVHATAGFVAGIVHDFNNLLVVILTSSQSLIECLSAEDERRTEAVAIKQAGERAAALARQLLALCRRHTPASSETDVGVSLRQLAPLLSRLLGKSIDVVTTIAEHVNLVRIDSGKLDQVVMNIAVNARDAMPHGGRLELTLTELELVREEPGYPRAVGPGRWVRLSVRDTGTGMSDETFARLFEPFFTTKEPGRGTGLGLSTMRAIVEEAGGVVQVHSKLGEGSRFDIYLPCQCNAAQQGKAA